MTNYAHNTQKAVYDALVAASVCSSRVYDETPQSGDAVFPYCVIGDGHTVADDYEGSAGVTEFYDINIWSQVQGFKEIKDQIDLIHTTLHQTSLTITGRNDASVFVTGTITRKESDGRTRRGIVSVKILHHT